MDRFAEWREVPFTDIDNFDYTHQTIFDHNPSYQKKQF